LLPGPSIVSISALASALRGRRILLNRLSLSTLFEAVTEVSVAPKSGRFE
jgi:hypothetical protein